MSFEIIGNIALINDKNKENLEKLKNKILKYHKKIETIYFSKIDSENIFRIKNLKLIYGKKNIMGIHTENNCKFNFNLKSCYISTKLNNEKKKILELITKKNFKNIADLSCGLGSWGILFLKKNLKVIFNELNSDCITLLKKNLKVNKIEQNYKIFQNSLEFIKFKKIDLAIINIPFKGIFYIHRLFYFLNHNKMGLIYIVNHIEQIKKLKKFFEINIFSIKKISVTITVYGVLLCKKNV